MSAKNPARAERVQIHFLWLGALLGLLSWLVPDHYPPWMSFYNEFAAFVGLWLLLVYCSSAAARNLVEIPRWVLGIVALAAIPLTQVALSHIYFAGDGWMAAAYILGLGFAIATGFTLARQDVAKFTTSLAWLFLLGALLSALLAIYQWLGLDYLGLWASSLPPGSRSSANLGQPNQLATLLCLGLAGVIYLHASQRISGLSTALIGVLLIFGVALTQSRTPWLGATFLAVWWMTKRKSIPQISGWTIGTGLLIYISLTVFWPELSKTPLTPTSGQRPDLLDPGAHFVNWQVMIEALWREPWWGYGWNQVSVAHVLNAHDHPLPELLSHSHNLLLDLVIWNGVPLGLLLIAGLVFWLVTRAWRCRTRESWFALLAVGCVGAHSLVEYPLDYAYFLLPVGLLIGVVEADQDTGVHLKIPRPALWLTVVVSAFFMGRVWHEYRIVEADYQLMRFETRRIGPMKAAQPAPDIFLLTQLREDLRMARSVANENMSAKELDWMRKVTYRYPYYSNLFRYALSLALNQRIPEASTEFRRLYDLYGEEPYADAKQAVRILADTRYPRLHAVLGQLAVQIP